MKHYLTKYLKIDIFSFSTDKILTLNMRPFKCLWSVRFFFFLNVLERSLLCSPGPHLFYRKIQ